MLWLLLALLALLLLSWGILKLLDTLARRDPQDFSQLSTVSVKGPSGTLRVALADTEDALARGISGHEKLKDVRGVLMVPRGKSTSVTMLGVRFPIDIVWLGQDNRVVHYRANARPGLWPVMIRSPKPAQKILEIPSEYTKKLGTLSEGTQLHIS